MFVALPSIIGFVVAVAVGITYWKLSKSPRKYTGLAIVVSWSASISIFIGGTLLKQANPYWQQYLFWAVFLFSLCVVLGRNWIDISIRRTILSLSVGRADLVQRIRIKVKSGILVFFPPDSLNDMIVTFKFKISRKGILFSFFAFVLIVASEKFLSFLFLNQNKNLNLWVWILRNFFLFSSALVAFAYLITAAAFAALKFFGVISVSLNLSGSFRCLVDCSGYSAAIATLFVLISPVWTLIFRSGGEGGNSTIPFSNSLLLNAASIGAFVGLVLGCVWGVLRLVNSKNYLFAVMLPTFFFGVFIRVVLDIAKVTPQRLLDWYLALYSVAGVDSCEDHETAKLLVDECLDGGCERLVIAVRNCETLIPANQRVLSGVLEHWDFWFANLLCGIVLLMFLVPVGYRLYVMRKQ